MYQLDKKQNPHYTNLNSLKSNQLIGGNKNVRKKQLE